AEIIAFKTDPACRVFLSTDSGSTGLNLQNASVVINCDLPWNPAKLEQRIARAWRKHQTRPVTVFNLVSENTLEHRMLDTLASKQALADGVLDLKGDLAAIKLRSGKSAFLAKLQQLVSPLPDHLKSQISNLKSPLPADRSLAFAHRVRETINGALVRCEERFPAEGPHSVLLIVVDGNATQYRPRLESLHAELFGPGRSDPLAPVQFEVIDRATDEALQRLLVSGLIAKTTRAARPLFPAVEGAATTPLSAEEQAKAQAHRAQAARRLKMARLLGDGGLAEEVRAPILDAIATLGRALALEARLPEPSNCNEAVRTPLAVCWKESLTVVRAFAADPSHPWLPVVEALARF
ncbi:MAG: hypothetical protein KGS61_17940, partial [Verrucomicrobia bacterium]|nr:hypothetical protein [Verrucomicrobiota bacterium]